MEDLSFLQNFIPYRSPTSSQENKGSTVKSHSDGPNSNGNPSITKAVFKFLQNFVFSLLAKTKSAYNG